jgi:hypothetical protein
MDKPLGNTGRPPKAEASRHPLYGQFDGEVPWLDGCTEHGKDSCLDCTIPLKECPAQNPRLHKGGRPPTKR